jgi:uncharacterized protein YndB with AHSA1/START domain
VDVGGRARGNAGSEQTLVTVDLVDEDGGTKVVLVHSGFTTGEARDLHTGGWTGCLDNLARRVFADGAHGGGAE